MAIEEEMLPMRTDCGLLLRKSRIQLHSDEQRPSSLDSKIGGGDGVEHGAVVDEQQPNICVLIIQVVKYRVESQ